MNQTEALVQFISDLNSLSVPYMITGAYAVSYFGLPRATHDLDIAYYGRFSLILRRI